MFSRQWLRRMPSSGMLRHVALVRTDVSEELSTLAAKKYHLLFLHNVRRLLVTAGVVPSSPILVTLMKEALSSSEMSVLTRATWRNIQEDAILHWKFRLPSMPLHCHELPQHLFSAFWLIYTPLLWGLKTCKRNEWWNAWSITWIASEWNLILSE
jgi:hypothetical protein